MKKILYFIIFPSLTLAFIPFGGKILDVSSACCNGLLLKIKRYYRPWPGYPPTLYEEKQYLFDNNSSRLIVGSLVPDKWCLGLATPGGQCLTPLEDIYEEITVTTTTGTTTVTTTEKVLVTPKCSISNPVEYTIYFIGTSILIQNPFQFPYK
jgi:hypothetical protein